MVKCPPPGHQLHVAPQGLGVAKPGSRLGCGARWLLEGRQLPLLGSEVKGGAPGLW